MAHGQAHGQCSLSQPCKACLELMTRKPTWPACADSRYTSLQLDVAMSATRYYNFNPIVPQSQSTLSSLTNTQWHDASPRVADPTRKLKSGHKGLQTRKASGGRKPPKKAPKEELRSPIRRNGLRSSIVASDRLRANEAADPDESHGEDPDEAYTEEDMEAMEAALLGGEVCYALDGGELAGFAQMLLPPAEVPPSSLFSPELVANLDQLSTPPAS